MEPTFRDQMIEMMGRMRAERMIQMATAIRVGNADQDQYSQMIDVWSEIAAGKQIDIDIDPRGRPITDNLDDFRRFIQLDRGTIEKYGYKFH